MTAALLRGGGTGVCIRCIHRELCRVVWRPQAAVFSSKPSDRKLPRRTHIKKAKPQPAVDVPKLLEQLYSHRRPDTAPPAAGKAQATKASPMLAKPPTTSSTKVSPSDVSHLSKTEPAVSVFSAAPHVSQKTASTLKTAPFVPQPKSASCKTPESSVYTERSQQSPLGFTQDFTAVGISSVTVPITSASPPNTTTPAPSGTEAPAVECHVSAETRETKVETARAACVLPSSVHEIDRNVELSSVPAATVEPSTEPATSPLESRVAVAEVPGEPVVETEGAYNYNTSKVESTIESSSGNAAVEEGVNESEEMTLESVTLHLVKSSLESLLTDELLQTKFHLDDKAEEQLQTLLVQTGVRSEHKAAAEADNSPEYEGETLTEVLSKWDSLSADLQELDTLLMELLCHFTGASDQPAAAHGGSLQMEEKATVEEEEEAMTLESVTLAAVKAGVGKLETEVLQVTCDALEKEADELAKEEKMEVETATKDVVLEDITEAEFLYLESISEATEAIEAEASVMLQSMFISESGPMQPPDPLLLKLAPQNDMSVLEAMSLESVTLAEVEASLGSLEDEHLRDTTAHLENEAEIIAGESRAEVVEEGNASEEMTEALNVESLSLTEADGLHEDLQTDALMEALLFTVPGQVTGGTEATTSQEIVRTNVLDATVDTVAAETDDFPASPAPTEVLLGQEVSEEGAQPEATGSEEALDPVQRLFLEKIREYNNMRRLSGGPVEAEPDYERHLLEETVKLQRLYGGGQGDLSSFPQFTFTEPKMDQDSK